MNPSAVDFVFEPVSVSLLCVQSCASSCSRILLIRDQQVKRRFRGSMLSDVVQARRKTLNSWNSSNPPCLLSGQFSVLTFHHGGCYVLLCRASTADDLPTSLCFTPESRHVKNERERAEIKAKNSFVPEKQ